jgi:hypothetical protein
VTAFSEGLPILVIADFQEPIGEEPVWAEYSDPLDKMRVMLVGEELKEDTEPGQIDSVRVYVDGFISAGSDGILRNSILEEEGVEIVATDPTLGLIEIIPKDLKIFDLHDVRQRINAMREYKVLKMDVVATGTLQEVEIEYGQKTALPQAVKRHKLSAGPFNFILSENKNLGEMLESGDVVYSVVGMITAFNAKVPILEIEAYKEIKEMPEWLKPGTF